MKRYIKMNSDGSKPIANWQDDANRFKALELISEKNISFVPEKGIVFVDADSQGAIEWIDQVNIRLNLRPFSYNTTNGKHYIYKTSDDKWFTSTEHNVYPPIGNTMRCSTREKVKYVNKQGNEKEDSQIDIKGNGRGYVCIKKRGAWRVEPSILEKELARNDIPEIPKMLSIPQNFYANRSTSYSDVDLVKFATSMYSKGMSKQAFVELVVELETFYNTGYSTADTIAWAGKKYDDGIKFAAQKQIVDKNIVWYDQKQIDKNIVLRLYKGEFYHLNNGIWTNINKEVGKDSLVDNYIKSLIRKAYPDGDVSQNLNKFYELKETTVTDGRINDKDINRYISVFKNGYYDLKQGKFVETNQIPFSINQKKYDWNENATNEIAERFINEMAGSDQDKRKLILEIIGSSFFSHNPSIFAIFHSSHSTSGKGSIVEWIRAATGGLRELRRDEVFEGSNRFAMSAIKNADTVFFDELPQSMDKGSAEKIKAFADSKKFQEIEGKNVNQEQVINSSTIYALTNKNVSFYDFDDALAKRIIYVNMMLNKDGKYSFTTSEIEELIENQASLQMLARLAINAYQAVFIKDGIRNTKFSLTKEHFEWIESKKIANNSMVEDIIDRSFEFKKALEDKEDFFPTSLLKQAYDDSKIWEIEKKYSFKAFKHDFIDYLSKQKHDVNDGQKWFNNKNNKGLIVKWYEEKKDDVLENIEL